jgi:hypothetical protein
LLNGWLAVVVTSALPPPLLTISKPLGLLVLVFFQVFQASVRSEPVGPFGEEILIASVAAVLVSNSLLVTAVSAVIITLGTSPTAPV